MATLVMTIDSDAEPEVYKKKSKLPKPVKEDDEEILLGHTVILNETQTTDGPVHVKVGSSQQWKFTDVLQLDAVKKDPDMDFDVNDKDERPPFKIPLSERCEEKLKAKGIVIPNYL